MYSSCRSIFFWLKLFFLGVDRSELAGSSATSVFPVRPLRLSCRTKWVNALRKSCGFSTENRQSYENRAAGLSIATAAQCSAGTHAPGAGRFGSCSGIRRHTIWTDPPGDTSDGLPPALFPKTQILKSGSASTNRSITLTSASSGIKSSIHVGE